MLENSLLYQYLFRFHQLPLGALGMIEFTRQNAVLQMLDKQIRSPFHKVEYTPLSSDISPLLQWIARHLSVSLHEAESYLEQYIDTLKQHVTNTGKAVWKDLGEWELNESGALYFRVADLSVPEVQTIPAEKRIRAQATHEVLIGDQTYSGDALHQLLDNQKNKIKISRYVTYVTIVITTAAVLITACLFIIPSMRHTHQKQMKLDINIPSETYKIIQAD